MCACGEEEKRREEKTIAFAIRSVDRWVSLHPSNFVGNKSSRAFSFIGRVSVYPLYPTYKNLTPPRPPLSKGGGNLLGSPSLARGEFVGVALLGKGGIILTTQPTRAV